MLPIVYERDTLSIPAMLLLPNFKMPKADVPPADLYYESIEILTHQTPQFLYRKQLIEYMVGLLTFPNKQAWKFIYVEFRYFYNGYYSPMGSLCIKNRGGFLRRLNDLAYDLIHGYDMNTFNKHVVYGRRVISAHTIEYIDGVSTRHFIRGSVEFDIVSVYRPVGKRTLNKRKRIAAAETMVADYFKILYKANAAL